VPIYNLMEDAATAEISRAQLWQWAHHGARLNNGVPVTRELVSATIDDAVAKTRGRLLPEQFAASKFELAARLFKEMTNSEEFPEFLTLAAYDHID
jgi:malate synthase